MNRIRALLSKPRQRKLLIPFFTVGFPNSETTKQLVLEAVEAGVDLIELGFPFSDPLADGPAIQYASHVALSKGTSLTSTLTLVSELRTQTDIPIVLMGYVNPVLASGFGKFCREASAAGVDGLIIPDLPIDEAGELELYVRENGLSITFLASPTTTSSRLKQIDSHSTDFVYAVTVAGVTGARKLFDSSTDTYLKGLRRYLTRPYVAGFGVSSVETARRLAAHCDGVVVGSALIERIRSESTQDKQLKSVTSFLTSIRSTL